MPNQYYMQNNFSHGELDPRMFAGTNLAYYYKSLKRARNVYVRPQGGVKKRHGTKYLETISASSGEYRMTSFVYTETQEFLLLFIVGGLKIYFLNAAGDVTSIQSIADASFTANNLPLIQFAQNGNQMIIVHEDFSPKVLTFDEATSLFVAPMANFVFKNAPAYDFRKDYYTYTFTIVPITVGKGAILTSSTAVFRAEHVGGVFISVGDSVVEPIGYARIRTVTGPYPALTATVDIIYPFGTTMNTTGALGDTSYLGEVAMSAVRGWPRAVTFYEDRLCFGGTSQLPQTLFISSIGSFEDFDGGDGSSDDAIMTTMSTESFNQIKYLVSDKTLQVYCTDSLFSSMQTFDEPLTPTDASFRKQASYGVNDLNPILMDNKTYICRKGGKAILEMIFDTGSNYYTPTITSLFSAILIANPTRGAALIGDNVDDGDYMFLLNEDGSMLSYQSVSQQDISAFTVCVTGSDHEDLEIVNPTHGKYKDITNVGNKIYSIIERVIDGITVQYLEKFTFDYFTDSTTTLTVPNPTTTVTGLLHLVGERPRVTGTGGRVLRVDGSPSANDGKVTAAGELTLLDSDVIFNTGLNFNLLIETVPANLAGQGRLYLPKKIVRCFVDYYESLGIQLNGEYIPELEFGNNVLDQSPQLKTGVFTTRGNEWGQRVTIQITQADPVPFLVIGLGFEVTE